MSKMETIFPTTVGERIKKIREERGMEKYEFYEFLFPEENKIQLESKKKNISNWEKPDDKIPLYVVQAICDKCNVSSDYLLGLEKEQTHDIHHISEVLGLSEESIRVLEFFNRKDIPNTMITEENEENIMGLNMILEEAYPYIAPYIHNHSKSGEEWFEIGGKASPRTVLLLIYEYITSAFVTRRIESEFEFLMERENSNRTINGQSNIIDTELYKRWVEFDTPHGTLIHPVGALYKTMVKDNINTRIEDMRKDYNEKHKEDFN